MTGHWKHEIRCPLHCTARGRAFRRSRGLGKAWTRCGITPCTQAWGEHPVFHSLVLLRDLKAQGKQTLVLPCPLTARERGRSAPGSEDSPSAPEPVGIALRSTACHLFP